MMLFKLSSKIVALEKELGQLLAKVHFRAWKERSGRSVLLGISAKATRRRGVPGCIPVFVFSA